MAVKYDKKWLMDQLKLRDIDFDTIIKPLDHKKYREEIKEFSIELDEDPCSDLQAVLANYAKIDAFNQRTLKISSIARRSLMRKEHMLKTINSVIELELFKLQSTDSEIIELSSADKRKAMAEQKIQDLRLLEDQITTDLVEAKAFMHDIDIKKEAIESSYNSLSRQQALIEGPILVVDPGKLKYHVGKSVKVNPD